jgi:hypothetical protein
MGVLNFTVGAYGRNGGKAVLDAGFSTSDAFGTSTSADFVEDGSGDITLTPGSIFVATASEPMWIRFGGSAATVGDGHYLAADVKEFFEIGPETAGKVSAIDVS